MAKPPKLEHVKFVRVKGRLYAYFNTGRTVDGRPVRVPMPKPLTPEFFAAYSALIGNRKPAPEGLTFAVMVDRYQRSTHWQSRADATRQLYTIQLAKAVDALGKFPVDAVEPRHVRKVSEQWKAGTRNAFVAAIGAAYQWARREGLTQAMPTRDIAKAEGGEHQPWPDAILHAGLTADDPQVRLAVHLLFYTGQRIGDVCAMRWNDIRDGLLTVRQAKTGKDCFIPLHSALARELDATPRTGMTILTDPHGRALKPSNLRTALQVFTAAQGQRTVPHGLRKNAVIALLEVGCTPHEVASITGQTIGMVEHYAKRVNRRALAKAAILKLENRR